MPDFLNFLINNYTQPIEYKDIYLGISFKLPYFTTIKHTTLNKTSIDLLNFNFSTFNNISINYLIISEKINITNENIEEIIKELLEFISFPTKEGYKLYLIELNKILKNLNNNIKGKTIELNLGSDIYINNPLLIISEKILDFRFLFRNQFIFKVELGVKFINENELIIYILLTDTYDINRSNWYKNFVLNSIKIENKLPYIKFPIKINNKPIGSINLIKIEANNTFSLFNLIDYKLYHYILNSPITLQNGEIIFNVINTYTGSQIIAELSNYLGKNKLNFNFNPIHNLNDILNMLFYFFNFYLNLNIVPENIYNINLDDLYNYLIKLRNINFIPLLITAINSDKPTILFLYITIIYNTILIKYQISSYEKNNSNNINDFLIITTNIINSITYDILFTFEKINYIINLEKTELKNYRTTQSASREISDIIYNELKKERQHKADLYNKVRQTNEYSSKIFREIQNDFEKDREAFTNAFSAAINNETYAKDPITNQIYRVPASSGFDNVEYYRDNYNYYSIPDIFQVKSYDYQTKQYLESQGYKKMRTDNFGFVYEE